ncbi:uncharacterized protein LOC111709172 [Eurytemora carolleeae]|uniref:uncharacterized protein LOC111709172 n=1 Tax=Eurytemora carolleeae TaxID=1294199 RepID=UPI000C77A2DD|nr:uncharacterized protein LOC111709172 [Eurytemora carolleeae]|eukprot:XP_023338549.1 uncharacterized protein LOC111709172 [Eurytemora affinis]
MTKNRSSQNTNQLIAKTRRSSENSSQSFENVIRSSRNTNRSSDNTNQLFENRIRSSENTNQLFENIIRSSDNTNQLSEENLFHPESWQTKAKQLNQNTGSTSFKVISETSKSYKNWHNRETSTRLDKGYESLKKEEYYIDSEQTIGYPDFYISHHEISSLMSETENPAINENSRTEALDLVKRIPEDDLSSYLMEVDSHPIRPYSSQMGMMDGNLFQPLSRDPIMNMTIEENILLGQKVRAWESVVSQVWKRNTETGADVLYKNPGGLIHEAEISKEGVISSSTDPSSNILVNVLDTQGILQQRICCTTLLAIAVRMFGGPKHQFFPDDQMVKDTFYLKYSYLLRSPWAPTLTEENMVISTMKETGYLLGPDRVLEVLFTNCLMVGFNMDSNQEEYLHTLGAKEDILPRNQALLLYRYLKNSMGTIHARALYSRLEVLVHKLEAAAQIFFNHRLMI